MILTCMLIFALLHAQVASTKADFKVTSRKANAEMAVKRKVIQQD